MKIAMKAAIIALAVAAAAPAVALAQPYGHPRPPGPPPGAVPGGWDLNRRVDWLQQRIDRGRMDGSLDRREARRVQRELDDLKGDLARARARPGPLAEPTRVRFERRLDEINDRTRWLRQNNERRPW